MKGWYKRMDERLLPRKLHGSLLEAGMASERTHETMALEKA